MLREVLNEFRRIVGELWQGGQAKSRWVVPTRSLAINDTQSPSKGQVRYSCASSVGLSIDLDFELKMLLPSARSELGAIASD